MDQLQGIINTLRTVLSVLLGGYVIWNAFQIYRNSQDGGDSGDYKKQINNTVAAGVAFFIITFGWEIVQFIANLVSDGTGIG